MKVEQQNRKNRVIEIVKNSLCYIDERLIDHGERVACIAMAIADEGNISFDRETLMLLSIFHDVGAYKTEEIDKMIAFETGNVASHAAYGYAFLKNATSMSDYSEAILYHHTNWDKLHAVNSKSKIAAELIFLADRIDILLAANRINGFKEIQKLSGSAFSPELVTFFLKAEENRKITDTVTSGEYKQMLREMTQNISLSEEEVMQYLSMIVFSIDFRSPFTVTHTANTVYISLKIAQLMGLEESDIDDIRSGSFLHDIGKIATPVSILESTGKLSDGEMRIMRNHVVASKEIISGIVPDKICQIAIRHHEKLNGKGYPYGLKAEELTTPQRIVAVADILSALINRRSYKEAFPREKTLSIIMNMADKGELCPEVCGIVAENYNEIIDYAQTEDNSVVLLYEKIQDDYIFAMNTLEKLK